jgi:hypothetical protein
MCQSKRFLQLLWPATEKGRTELWICCINKQSLCKETTGKCCKKERTGDEKIWKRSVQKVTVTLRRHCSNKPFEGSEDIPCLYCNELFSISEPGESWIRYTECSVWAHCVLDFQKE